MRPALRRRQLEAMMRALRHRGPDDEGLALWDAAGRVIRDERPGAAGLVHTRLSVIDLSSAGHQPMPSADENLWITFNGEIYNFEEQRRDLAARGRLFRSRTDTETILNLYEEHGLDGALARMNGMFAFAIWDHRRRTLALARDRVGKKPLYYTLQPDGTLLFASEIKALLASGCVDASSLDEAAILQFWTYGYVMGERTFFRDIRRLPPGHCAEWSDGKLSTRAYWDCPFGQGGWADRSLDSLADELEALLDDAIRLRLTADVPVGLFLSGGIDSSLVAAMAHRVAGPGLQSFTIAFTEESHDESKHAAAVARHLGMGNRVLTVAEHMQDHFQSIARHFDEPFGDSSAIPTFFVSALARRHVTVALTGDGGDELFAGYQTHIEALRLWGSAQQRRTLRRPRGARERLFDLRARLVAPAQRMLFWERISTQRQRQRIFSDDFLRDVRQVDAFSERRQWNRSALDGDLLSQVQYLNVKTYLPDDILVKVDRMSMAHALETRSPLLDFRVVEFAARLPAHAKIDEAGRGKSLLRHLLARHIPRELFERPKQGFAVPWASWCRGEYAPELARRWETLCGTVFRPGSSASLFPVSGTGSERMQWNALATLACQTGGQS